MSGILHKGGSLKSSPVGTLNGLEFVFDNAAWSSADSIQVEVMAPTVRDSSRYVAEIRGDTAVNPKIVYYSASFNVLLTEGRHPAPALPIKDVMVLYQESITKMKRNGGPSDYGKTFVRLGVPTSLVSRIVGSMNRQGVHVENPPIKNSTTVMVNFGADTSGKPRLVPYTVFTSNIEARGNVNVRVGYGDKDAAGAAVFVPMEDLVVPLSKGRDMEAHSTLAVKAKYSGPPPAGDWKSVKYHLALEPQLLSLTDSYSEDPVAPNITGGADAKASATLPEGAAVSNEFKSFFLA